MSKNFRLPCTIELQPLSLTPLKMRKVELGTSATTGPAGPGQLRRARHQRPGLWTARHRQDPRALRPGPPPGGSRPLRPLRTGLPPGTGAAGRQARPGPAPPAAQAGQLRLPAPGRPGLPASGRRGAEVLFTLIAERYERRSLGITSNLVFSEWERIFANPMATAAAIDRVVHHSVILEFDVPSYRTDAAQQRGQAEEVNRQN